MLRKAQRWVYLALALVFFAVGLLGFFGKLRFLLSNSTQNSIYLVIGFLLASAAKQGSLKNMDFWARVFGVILAVFFILGFTMPYGEVFSYLTFNLWDNLFHLLPALILLLYGFFPKPALIIPLHDLSSALAEEQAIADAKEKEKDPIVHGSAVVDLRPQRPAVNGEQRSSNS